MSEQYRVELSQKARRQLENGLPEKVAAAVVEFLAGPLAENPYRVGKALRGEYEGFFGARRGEYRVIYRVLDHEVLVYVVLISHRRDAYRS